MIATPLERNCHARLSTSQEIGAWLRELVATSRGARVSDIGVSAGGRPLAALALTGPPHPAGDPLRVLLVGSQHGASEGAGCEALLALARELLADSAQAIAGLALLIVPNANPDGRDLGTSKNANEVNLNRDFVLLSQPESRRLDELLAKFAPHVVLDAHESAAWKRKTLGQEGYLTEFQAQFDVGNNPAIPASLRSYTEDQLLPALIRRVEVTGLSAQRYFREVLSTRQPITHGGLSLRRFRNKAALPGAVSVLLETRLDPSDGVYPTWRNIGVRVEKQLVCMRAFLRLVTTERAQLLRAVDAARDAVLEPLALAAEYGPDPASRTVHVPLRRIATQERVELPFPDHRRVSARHHVAVPEAYWIADHVEAIQEVLTRHGIAGRRVQGAAAARVVAQRYVHDGASPGRWRLGDEAEAERRFVADTLRVPRSARHARVLPLLLDPRSPSSIFRYPAFARMIPTDAEFFVYRESIAGSSNP